MTAKSHLLLLQACALLCVTSYPYDAHGQNADAALLANWVALDAPTGHEQLATAPLEALYPDWQHDRYGNLVRTIGSGRPHRVVACGLDSYAYSVSQITEDGYLRLHRIGAGSRHPLWDQSHEGEQLRVLTRSGPLAAVSAVANGHFAIQHRDETALVTQNDLWVDVGAETADEVASMGIQLLDPIVRNLPAWFYADEVAGPRSGARVACAAVLAAAEASLNAEQGSTSYVLSVQQVFGWTGLAASLRWLPPADELILVGPGADVRRNETVQSAAASLDQVIAERGIATQRLLAAAVDNPDALMERVTVAEATALLTALVQAVNPDASLPTWQPAPGQNPVVNADPERRGATPTSERLQLIEQRLDALAETYAVTRHEGPVRHLVREALPQWAQERAQTDELGNLWVEFGAAQGEATVFIAHMDEVGWEISAIAADGTVALRALGGVVSTAWEGQPAVLQLDSGFAASSQASPAQLKGVFLTRSTPEQKQPATVSAWFGMDGEQLERAGVRPGMGLTHLKEGHRMGGHRYASRSMDDRVGVTALLTAIQEIDPDAIPGRNIFAWSVQEEGGLNGAGALAARYKDETRRVYSIDTFVSSDTPLESPHFAYAPLGSGPVLRSIENGSMATPAELDRNRAVAAAAGIRVQLGHTQGGTDGTRFTFFGAPNAGLSWPGRYSHSPAELSDLRDIEGLVDLIKAMASAPE